MSLEAFLNQSDPVVRVALTRVRGSSPREAGTEMYARRDGTWGTVGGGQLEHRAIDAALAILESGQIAETLDLPLGPEIGQCCGGRVEIELTRMSRSDRLAALERDVRDTARQPHIYILGAGHVGRALAEQFQHLPVKTILVDQREDELHQCRAVVDTRLSAIPEVEIMTAPPGSGFIVLTHDHGLDFLLASAALERGDAAYVGLIGSATKRAKFRNWCQKQCDGLSIDSLNCPIGAGGSRDKRPAVIATFVVAEVIATLTSEPAANAPFGEAVSQIAAQ